MNNERIKMIRSLADFRIGMDNVLNFMESNSIDQMVVDRFTEARMALGRACLYLGSPNPYPNATEPLNQKIELSVDIADITPQPEYNKTMAIKSIIVSCEMFLAEIVDIRIRPMYPKSPASGYLLTRSIDRCIDALEESICWLNHNLRVIRVNDPEDYNQRMEVIEGNPIPEDVRRTDAIMKNRIVLDSKG
jgi:hypothetical protein